MREGVWERAGVEAAYSGVAHSAGNVAVSELCKRLWDFTKCLPIGLTHTPLYPGTRKHPSSSLSSGPWPMRPVTCLLAVADPISCPTVGILPPLEFSFTPPGVPEKIKKTKNARMDINKRHGRINRIPRHTPEHPSIPEKRRKSRS